MKERELARIVRGALDESAERLSYRTARRLAAARADALAHARSGGPAAHAALRVAHRPAAESAGATPPRLVWRIAAVVVPIGVVAIGLVGISVWETQQRADDLAALDAAMLADDVPISAYADRGFGVFLRNVSWEAAEE